MGVRDQLIEVVLGGGTSDAARLRGWHRRILLSEYDRRGRLTLLKRAAVWPLRAAKQAWIASRDFGGPVTGVYGVSRLRQFAQQWRFAVMSGIPPVKYYSFRLFMPERRYQASKFMCSEEMHHLFMTLARHQGPEEASLLDDKESFLEWCRNHGLPTPGILRVYSAGEAIAGDLPTDAPLPDVDLFSKPKDFRWGIGSARWFCIGEGYYRDEAGVTLSGEDVEARLKQQSLDLPVILQERLRNHSAIADLSNGGLCTVRLVTSRPPGGKPQAVIAAFGMPRGQAPASNFRYSVVSPVNLRNGQLGLAIEKEPVHCVQSWDHHPDTKAPIAGRLLPLWAECVSLAERAHDEVEHISSLGWDIALLDDGPVLIEVNVSWGLDTVQMPSGTPITVTQFAGHYLAHVRQVYTQA